MTYDQKICDQYVLHLTLLNMAKDNAKFLQKCLREIDQIHHVVNTNASSAVKKSIIMKIETNKRKLISLKEASAKATKAYKQYCDNKEQS